MCGLWHGCCISSSRDSRQHQNHRNAVALCDSGTRYKCPDLLLKTRNYSESDLDTGEIHFVDVGQHLRDLVAVL